MDTRLSELNEKENGRLWNKKKHNNEEKLKPTTKPDTGIVGGNEMGRQDHTAYPWIDPKAEGVYCLRVLVRM